MKKIFKYFLFVCMALIPFGCSNKVTSSNVLSFNYNEVNSNDDIINNIKNSIMQVNGIGFDGVVKRDNKNYDFNGKIIFGDSIENSIINVNFKNMDIYLKKGNVYVSFMYNNTNVIIKDSLDNFINEVVIVLESKGIKCNKNMINEFIKGKGLQDINYNGLKKAVFNNNGGKYGILYKGYEIGLNKDFLPEDMKYSNKQDEVGLKMNYNDVSIKVPLGYDLITININNLKELLQIDNLSELVKL